MMLTLLRPLASLKLSVVLFALAMFLILAGTLAQVHEGVWTVVDRYFRSLWVAIPLQIFVPRDVMRVPGAILFPGGFLIAGLMLVNLVSAHAVRFKLTWKRLGIIIAHAGIILLLVGEFVTGLAATEGNMSIQEGESSNFVEDIRVAELAVIDSSGPADDYVVVVPERMLSKAGTTVSDPLLPFDVMVDRWLPNSVIPRESTAQQRAGADRGIGVEAAAVQVPRVTGVDGQMMDAPSAYVTLVKGGRRLGSYMVSVRIGQPQLVEVEGRVYGLELRFRRTYTPYEVHLIDFRHDKFVGTITPRNFSSRVRLSDPARSVDREVLISMNSPLRYAGETFYQQSFKEDDSGTVLQVVRNPGWLLPYVSCAMVAVGLLMHFGMKLAPAVGRRVA